MSIKLSAPVHDKAAQVGELLIRAAAIIGTLSPEQQAELADAGGGQLVSGIATALDGAAELSPRVSESLRTHPPVGFIARRSGK